jgi:hypothetical protein
MPQNWLLPQMSEDSGDFIFQQDRAPPHWHWDVRSFLNDSLPQQWIGRVRKEDLALQFWPPRSPDFTLSDFFLWGVRKRSSLCTISTNNFGRPNKPYHNCSELSDARHSSLGVEQIRLPSRCYPCGRTGAQSTFINFIVSLIKCNLHHICH